MTTGSTRSGRDCANPSEHPGDAHRRGGGTDSSAKLLTAAPRRRGAGRREYQTLPSLIVGDVATDIAQYVGDETRRAFTDSTWGLTTFNDAIYGVPQDVGPMALIYNQARFAELGITVPTTWAEFATAAEQVRKADPSTYIGTFSPEVFGFFAGMSQQAGAKWWEVDGETWTAGILDEASGSVAAYWQDLVDREAPLPQWTPGDKADAHQCGSGVVVSRWSPRPAEHPHEAAEFAAWINS
ncbi:MAG TPA: extracellular solute-binding protein [Nakamurella sp.]